MTIEDEINQQRFENAQQQAAMNVIFTANWLTNTYALALKPLDLSLQQLNVLSILKGQPKHRATVNFIRERLIDRMPNVSRLLNKLMEKGLIQKDRNTSDQRVVHILLTEKGAEAARKGRTIFQAVTYELSHDKAVLLNDLLNEFRA
ncbi:MarR family winged helix-turn-helix transcriptional regulator [Spirosoma radiotolerans]|uniref:Transcriptional regulator, MarR family protein n=1 Tax=Spirosoma radiotolerans TaxID=1379870 RepID=A0A0E3V6A3_9BACT|nr:MarR family transcriptional regulator [Spirosoma radiotolerans]AKD54356.1 transcriptional regulator, MarR family protein [Spirosoma radiotolerans]